MAKQLSSAALLTRVGNLPGIGNGLRWYARRFKEGSIVTIPRGRGAGLRWARHHRYVSGYWIGIYELPLQEVLFRTLRRGDVVYDIGANAGFFTLIAANLVGESGRVFSFEPLPENIESIERQIALNSLGHCTIVKAAVSGESGTAAFARGNNSSMAHLASVGEPAKEELDSNLLSVPTIQLDEFVEEHPWPQFMKIDVEGAEDQVLSGARALLSSPRAPKILIELHGEAKARAADSLFSEFGYGVYDLDGRLLPHGAVGSRHVVALPHSRGGS